MASYEQIFEALRNRPTCLHLGGHAVPAFRVRTTREALEAIGVKLSPRSLETLCWSDRIQDLWDEAEYAFKRQTFPAKRKVEK